MPFRLTMSAAGRDVFAQPTIAKLGKFYNAAKIFLNNFFCPQPTNDYICDRKINGKNHEKHSLRRDGLRHHQKRKLVLRR